MDKNGRITLIALVVLSAVLLAVLVIAGNGASSKSVAQCKDRIDNDGDGNIDYPNDPGCSSKNDNDEINCGDGVVSSGEVCDGGSQTCTLNGYSGTQACNTQCSGWDSCQTTEYCGDGICNGAETSDTCSTDCGQPDSCSDTDGGIFANTQGTTSGYFGGSQYSNTDNCVDSTTLTENYCSGNTPLQYTLNCFGNGTTQCSSGACI